MARRRLSGGNLGVLKDFVDPEFQQNLKVGAMAAVGTYVVDQVIDRVEKWRAQKARQANQTYQPLSLEMQAVLSIGIGALLGGLVYRTFKRRDLAGALVIGPVATSVTALLSTWLKPAAATTSGVGLVLPPDQDMQVQVTGQQEGNEVGLVTSVEPQVSLPSAPIQSIPTVVQASF